MLWTLIGLNEIARVANRVGHADRLEHITTLFDSLMAAFRASADRHMESLDDGTPYLPTRIPGESGDHARLEDFSGEPAPWHRINPATATYALAHAIYPGELFDSDDPLTRNLLHLVDLIDNEQGIPENIDWLKYKAVIPYFSSFYAHVWLCAGRPDKALDYIYAFANHAARTRVWREEQGFT